MKVIILAAGYATRLYPKTKNTPKALLQYKDRVVLDYILDDLNHYLITEIIIVTNHKFYDQFDKYIKNRKENIRLIDDKSTDNSNRLGALNDLKLALNDIRDDILIMASDNILDFSINNFIDYYYKDNISSIMYYEEYDINKLNKTGQAVIKDNKLIEFKEKPKNMISIYAVPPFYIFNSKDIKYIKEIKESFDSLGSIIELIYNKIDIKCYKMIGKRIDIGS